MSKKKRSDNNADDELFQEGKAGAITDADNKGFQPVLPTTRAGRVQKRPTKLQDFEMHYHAASIDGVKWSIQANFYSALCDLEEK